MIRLLRVAALGLICQGLGNANIDESLPSTYVTLDLMQKEVSVRVKLRVRGGVRIPVDRPVESEVMLTLTPTLNQRE
jgi:hypothetical protein